MKFSMEIIAMFTLVGMASILETGATGRRNKGKAVMGDSSGRPAVQGQGSSSRRYQNDERQEAIAEYGTNADPQYRRPTDIQKILNAHPAKHLRLLDSSYIPKLPLHNGGEQISDHGKNFNPQHQSSDLFERLHDKVIGGFGPFPVSGNMNYASREQISGHGKNVNPQHQRPSDIQQTPNAHPAKHSGLLDPSNIPQLPLHDGREQISNHGENVNAQDQRRSDDMEELYGESIFSFGSSPMSEYWND